MHQANSPMQRFQAFYDGQMGGEPTAKKSSLATWLLIGAVGGLSYFSNRDDEYNARYDQFIYHTVLANEQIAEAAAFTDKNLENVMQKIQNKIDEAAERNPRLPRAKISSGLRGTRYFIEFPIIGKNVDSFRIFNYVKSKMEDAK